MKRIGRRLMAGSSMIAFAAVLVCAAAPLAPPPDRDGAASAERPKVTKALAPVSAEAIQRPGKIAPSPEGVSSSYGTGFEFPDGFTPGPVVGQAGWTAFGATDPEAHIDEVNPESGYQHLRLSLDPAQSAGTSVGGFSPNLGPQAPQPVTVSVDVAISADGGADYEVVPQSPTEVLVLTRVLFYFDDTDIVPDGLPNIFVLDDLGAGTVFVDTGANWIPDGAYRNLRISADPIAGTMDIAYDGSVIYSMGLPFAQTVEEVVIRSDNSNVADDGDFDNLVIRQPTGENELALEVPPSPWNVGDQLTVELWMRNLNGNANGFQAFLEFDDSLLAYNGLASSYTALPFPLHIQDILTADVSPGMLELDGTDGPAGPGTDRDSLLATLVFDVLGECDLTAILFDMDAGFESELSLNGTPLATQLVPMGPVVLDYTAPTFVTFPADATVECDESTEPGILYGIADGGIAIYYNDNGNGENPDNQAFLKAQFDGTKDLLGGVNGTQFDFDDTDLVGIPGVLNWTILYSGLGPPQQFGMDFVLPALTNDGSVAVPPLLAYDNGDNSLAGRILVGPVTWAISDYKGADSGPSNPANDVINSLIRSQSPGNPLVDVEITQLDLTGGDPVFVADVAGRLRSDGIHHWFTPSTPDSPMSNFGLDGEFFFSGTLTYDSTGDDGTDLIDFYAGQLTVAANSPNLDLGFPTAIDNCTFFPVITYTDEIIPDAGGCASILQILRTWRATDDCGNFFEQVQTITVVDTTPPEIFDCPADITVNADAGGCDAVVTWTPPTATDNCELDTFFSVPAPGSVFAQGTTPVTYFATDCAGNVTTCQFNVIVLPLNTVQVTVELVDSLPATRCIRIVNGTDCAEALELPMTFTDHDAIPATPVRATATIELLCGDIPAVCAKDPQHSTWGTAALSIVDTEYVSDVITLDLGDTDDDGDVDINDVTWLIFTFGQLAADGGCPWDGTRDADFDNNGAVESIDYSLQIARWLTLSNCSCDVTATAASPAVSTDQLDPQVAEAVDLNRDGTFDHHDVAIFEQRNGLPDDLSRAIANHATGRARR